MDYNFDRTKRAVSGRAEGWADFLRKKIVTELDGCHGEVDGEPVEIHAVSKEFAPMGADGRLGFMLDVRAMDGSSHIEFVVYQTGWGGQPVGPIDVRVKDRDK